MKEVAKKKIMIGALSVAIVVSLGFSIYTSKHLNDDNDKETPKTSQVSQNQKGEGDKAKDKDEEPVYTNPMNEGKEDPVLTEGKKELSVGEMKGKEQEVRDLYREYKFDEGIKELDKLQSSYKFTEDAEVLKKLQDDGALFSNLFSGHLTDEDGEVNGLALVNLMGAFEDPEDLLIAMLHLDSDLRQYVILYDGSLNPVLYEEKTYPLISKKTTEEIPHEIGIMYPETKTYHKIEFTLEKFKLEAYILEDESGVLRFYMIKDPYNKSNYYTIGQWTKMEENRQSGRPIMDGVMELKDKANDGISTPTIEEEVESFEDTPVESTTETNENKK
ncbi:hypothetical protein CVD28_04625 [Bacillus sp. M6-12]|uniref:hypothetical protein n=1 Tax=Bacillus sp. M6-12 TaxID=2054166 RepID=UPI000C7720B6|nr:hypothetical protein [Bacillus sp. M6-12]PLS19702.1 hypothetical protein CVD28_04625 [Bacillus sp. M6-12]